MTTTRQAIVSAAASNLTANLQPLTQAASRQEMQTTTPNTTVPVAQDACQAVSRRPSAAVQDPRAAMAAVRAQLQVTYVVNTHACRESETQQSAAIISSIMVHSVSDQSGTSAEKCTISNLFVTVVCRPVRVQQRRRSAGSALRSSAWRLRGSSGAA